MQEYGRTVVGPAQPQTRSATWLGNATSTWAWSRDTAPFVGGTLLRFERTELLVATLADEWICQPCLIPDELRQYLSLIGWLSSPGQPTG
jgi:hypothetical protein